MSDELEAFKGELSETWVAQETLVSPDIGATLGVSPHTAKSVEVLRSLPRMNLGKTGAMGPDLDVQGKLGEGGMGVVMLAKQSPLDRLVAVKSTHDGESASAVAALLQEAYITGVVEHPNVVPIYSVGKDETGRPIIVMKRIEGTSWQDVIMDASRAPLGVEADLVWHLQILLEVCDAIRFAHSRGIIHRDIKPENVMIGNYGEVYVLDWGIAVSVSAEFNAMMPDRQNAPGIAGTPAFMAPEQTDDTAANIDERTDIYMLGATLHLILTGKFRNVGKNNLQAMFAARMTQPFEYGPEIPEELGEIANRATAADKAGRFQSVAELKSALASYLEHRASLKLSSQALQVWLESKHMLETKRDEATELLVHERLNECRFGFRESLSLWPENKEARAGLQTVLEALVDFYISIQNDVGAAAAVKQFLEPRPEIQAQVEELANRREAERQEVKRLKELRASFDLGTGASARSISALVLGVFFVWSNVSFQMAVNDGDFENPMYQHVLSSPRSILIASVVIFFFRKRLFANTANRRIIQVIMGGLFAVMFMRIVAYQADISLTVAQALEIFLWGFIASAVGMVTDDWRILVASFPIYAAGFLGFYYPAYQLYPMAAAVGLYFLILALVWTVRPKSQKALSS